MKNEKDKFCLELSNKTVYAYEHIKEVKNILSKFVDKDNLEKTIITVLDLQSAFACDLNYALEKLPEALKVNADVCYKKIDGMAFEIGKHYKPVITLHRAINDLKEAIINELTNLINLISKFMKKDKFMKIKKFEPIEYEIENLPKCKDFKAGNIYSIEMDKDYYPLKTFIICGNADKCKNHDINCQRIETLKSESKKEKDL